jgi:hypothetical protein
MPRKIVDLSIYLENDVVSDPPPFGPKISYMATTRPFADGAVFPGLKQEDLPDGAAWAVEKVDSSRTTARTWTRPTTSIRR